MEEFPFEIPQNWAWCRLGEVAQSNIGLTYKPTDISENGVPVLRSNNIQNDKLFLEDLVRVSCQIQDKNYINNGDILICARNGSRNLLGKSTIINNLQEPMVFGAFMAICRSDYNDWIFQVLRTNYFQRYLDNSNSTTINQITQSMLLNFLFPLPPLSEQRRIVSKIEEIFALIDELEINKTDLQTLIKQTKTKVLDLAIRGKLLNEENALSFEEATSDNGHYNDFPFPIPKHWQWKKLGEIYDLQNGYAFKSSDYIEFSNTLVFRMSQIRPGGGIDFENNPKYVPDSFAIKQKDFLLKEGDVVIAMTDMATETKILGVPTQLPYDKRNWLLNQRVGKLFEKKQNILNPSFLKYVLVSDFTNKYYKSFGKGGVQINIGKKEILNARIPLPPLPEQKEIVQKIEKIFSELEKIETMING